MLKISNKLKAVVAAIGTVVTATLAAFADDVLSVDETGTVIATVIAAAATIYGVYRVPNKEPQ